MASFIHHDQYKDFEHEVRRTNADSLKNLVGGLSSFDRRYLKTYFSYIPVKGLDDRKIKDKISATQFVRNILWPDSVQGETYSEENYSPFDIQKELLAKGPTDEIITIFPQDEEFYKNLFNDGAVVLTPQQEEIIVKTMQVTLEFIVSSKK